ncbi:MAG: ABC transporter permease [Xanthobacteraceae bacterium]|nr:ABC transporter permease [Xanthobacteraceae bacterium]
MADRARDSAINRPSRRSAFGRHIANLYQLAIKELRSIRADPLMLVLVLYSFSIAVYMVTTGASTEVRNMTVGFVDEDHSSLSRQLRDALLPPLFQRTISLSAAEMDAALDQGRMVFVVVAPPKFEADVLAGRPTSIQINVDATAMAQAGNGAIYIQNILNSEITRFKARREGSSEAPVNLVIRSKFNPNLTPSWFTAVMQVVNNLTLLTVILSGAALIREREQGTVEHLLVMPVVPTEIMLAKIVANGLVIVSAAGLSLALVVQWLLGVPIAGSLVLFLLGGALYAFTVAALGILLGTLATTMGQFALLAIPVLLVMQLLSGSTTPMESMPLWLRTVMLTISPTPHFVAFAQAVLYRGADLSIVWPQLLALVALGCGYFAFSLRRFRRVIFGA